MKFLWTLSCVYRFPGQHRSKPILGITLKWYWWGTNVTWMRREWSLSRRGSTLPTSWVSHAVYFRQVRQLANHKRGLFWQVSSTTKQAPRRTSTSDKCSSAWLTLSAWRCPKESMRTPRWSPAPKPPGSPTSRPSYLKIVADFNLATTTGRGHDVVWNWVAWQSEPTC